MFSGIVEEVGRVRELGSHHISVEARAMLSDTKVSDSISVNGVCLTIIAVESDSFAAEIMPETLHRTNLGSVSPGDAVNLERAVTPSTRLGGHIVLGHVDGVGRVLSLVAEEPAVIMSVQAPADLMRYIAMKGSIAIDGVSLTVARLMPDSFAVSLVSYTISQTTLGVAHPGRLVNLEVDVIARYLERLYARSGATEGVTWELLRQHGYV